MGRGVGSPSRSEFYFLLNTHYLDELINGVIMFEIRRIHLKRCIGNSSRYRSARWIKVKINPKQHLIIKKELIPSIADTITQQCQEAHIKQSGLFIHESNLKTDLELLNLIGLATLKHENDRTYDITRQKVREDNASDLHITDFSSRIDND